MKKLLLAVIALVFIGATSCQKEENVQPQASSNAVKVDKKETTQWD